MRNEPDKPTPTLLPVAPQWEYITPEVAAHYLSLNKENRPLSEARVVELSRELRAGAWSLTHQGIAFDVNGHLRDGQHRLAACVRTGIGFWALVTRDLSLEAFSKIDVGRPRTSSHLLALKGLNYTTLTGASAKAVLCYRETVLGRWNSLASAFGRARPAREVAEAVDFFVGLHDLAPTAKRFAKLTALPSPGAVNAALYQCSLANAETTGAFIDGVLTGAGLEPGDPRLTLRNRLQRSDIRTKRANFGMVQANVITLVLGAWRALHQGKTWSRAIPSANLPVVGPTDLPLNDVPF